MALFMEKTKIEASQTVGEIQRLLGAAGCAGIMTMYENKEVKSVAFKIMFMDKNIAFNLPCRWKPIYDKLVIGVKKPRNNTYIELEVQAKRVAWRQIYRWVQAQLALVETEMVKVQEVFLPYAQVGIDGKTLYQELEERSFKMLEHLKEE